MSKCIIYSALLCLEIDYALYRNMLDSVCCSYWNIIGVEQLTFTHFRILDTTLAAVILTIEVVIKDASFLYEHCLRVVVVDMKMVKSLDMATTMQELVIIDAIGMISRMIKLYLAT